MDGGFIQKHRLKLSRKFFIQTWGDTGNEAYDPDPHTEKGKYSSYLEMLIGGTDTVAEVQK